MRTMPLLERRAVLQEHLRCAGPPHLLSGHIESGLARP